MDASAPDNKLTSASFTRPEIGIPSAGFGKPRLIDFRLVSQVNAQ